MYAEVRTRKYGPARPTVAVSNRESEHRPAVETERAPAHVICSGRPGDPRRPPRPSRDPEPAVAREPPPSVVMGGPRPPVNTHPRPAVRPHRRPVAVVVRTPIG